MGRVGADGGEGMTAEEWALCVTMGVVLLIPVGLVASMLWELAVAPALSRAWAMRPLRFRLWLVRRALRRSLKAKVIEARHEALCAEIRAEAEAPAATGEQSGRLSVVGR